MSEQALAVWFLNGSREAVTDVGNDIHCPAKDVEARQATEGHDKKHEREKVGFGSGVVDAHDIYNLSEEQGLPRVNGTYERTQLVDRSDAMLLEGDIYFLQHTPKQLGCTIESAQELCVRGARHS